MSGGSPSGADEAAAELAAVVVHWHDEPGLAELARRWPAGDPRFELVVVDNGSSRPLPELPGRLLVPARNLGFAGGAAAGVAATRAPIVLLLNPDAAPEPEALEALLAGFAAHPEAAGLAPRLVGTDGRPQHRWQLKPLPGPARLALEALGAPAPAGATREPAAGTPVEQPAAAALALRRSAWERVGGMDPGYFPAWFEDVDLARRLADAGLPLLYHPEARFRHGLGATVPRLGFAAFLWIYARSRVRYVRRHHGRTWAAAATAATAAGALLRLALLPLRRPRRAATRREAIRALAGVAAGAATGWRHPRHLARAYAAPAGEERAEERSERAG